MKTLNDKRLEKNLINSFIRDFWENHLELAHDLMIKLEAKILVMINTHLVDRQLENDYIFSETEKNKINTTIITDIRWTIITELLNNDLKWRIKLDTEKQIEELKEDKKVIFNKIADLRDYIYESDEIEREYILEQLQDMQQYAK